MKNTNKQLNTILVNIKRIVKCLNHKLNLKVFIFVLIVSTINSFSQNNTFNIDSLILNGRLNDSVATYYNFIYKAEARIMNHDYKKAAIFYSEAFKYIEYPFLMDLSNALNCEMKIEGNENNIKKYIYLLIRKHGLKKGILENPIYKQLNNWPEIEAMIDTIHPVFDTVTVNALKNIKAIDQGCRKQAREKYGTTYNEFSIDSITTIDSLNYLKILKIIDGYTYVSEEIIGNNYDIIDLIIKHNRGNFVIFEKLYKSMLNGMLDARNYSFSLTNSNHSITSDYSLGFTENGIRIAKGTYIYFKPDNKTKRKNNEFRTKLYLEPMQNFHKKLIWQMRNENSGFVFSFGYTLLLDDDQYYNVIVNDQFLGEKQHNMKIYYLNRAYKKARLQEARNWKKIIKCR